MAKTTAAAESGGLEPKATAELKRELQRVVNNILEDDEYTVEATDRAMQTLCALKDLKLLQSQNKSRESSGLCNLSLNIPPPEFRCPISGQLMKDPVVIASGLTYDRQSIQKWLKDGHRVCPQTEQVLSHTVLTPNYLVKDLISKWCKEHQVEFQSPVVGDEDEIITSADREHLISLLEKMLSSSLSDQKNAAKEIRLLTKRTPSTRALFGEIKDSIPQLLSPFLSGKVYSHPDLQEDLIATILNISIHESNKKLVAEHPMVIPLLIESLELGSVETKSNAAAALFTLSALDSNKYIIGKSGALDPLIKLLEEGNPLAIKDAAAAIFNLCMVLENKGRAVAEGAVSVVLRMINDGILVDELLAILAMLSSHQKAIDEMGELGAVSCLLNLLRESTNERNKENCIAILHTMCFNDRTKLREIRKEENANRTISNLAQSGTSRAKRKANGILERLKRADYITHTA